MKSLTFGSQLLIKSQHKPCQYAHDHRAANDASHSLILKLKIACEAVPCEGRDGILVCPLWDHHVQRHGRLEVHSGSHLNPTFLDKVVETFPRAASLLVYPWDRGDVIEFTSVSVRLDPEQRKSYHSSWYTMQLRQRLNQVLLQETKAFIPVIRTCCGALPPLSTLSEGFFNGSSNPPPVFGIWKGQTRGIMTAMAAMVAAPCLQQRGFASLFWPRHSKENPTMEGP